MNSAFKNRHYRRAQASVLRGQETTVTVEISPNIPKPVFFPVGTEFKTSTGQKVSTIEEVMVKKKWWWKWKAKFLKKWQPKVILKVRFV